VWLGLEESRSIQLSFEKKNWRLASRRRDGIREKISSSHEQRQGLMKGGKGGETCWKGNTLLTDNGEVGGIPTQRGKGLCCNQEGKTTYLFCRGKTD